MKLTSDILLKNGWKYFEENPTSKVKEAGFFYPGTEGFKFGCFFISKDELEIDSEQMIMASEKFIQSLG